MYLVVAACVSSLSAQAPVSATSSASVGTQPKPGKPDTKPPAKPKTETPKAKYLVEVKELPAKTVHSNGCYANDLPFPATNADQVAKELSSYSDFTFVAIPPDRIAIYYKSTVWNQQEVTRIEQDIDKLATADFRYAQAVPVPHGSAAKTLKHLNLPPDSPITAAAVGNNCILLLSKTQTPDPVALAILSKSLPQIYWGIETTQPTQRLFHLDALSTVKKLSGASDSADKASGDGAGDSANSKSAGKSSAPKTTGASSSKSSSDPGSTVAQNIAVSVAAGGGPADSSGPAGEDSTGPSSDSGSGKSPTDKASSPDKAQSDKAKKDAPAPPKPPTMQPVNDTLVYSNEDGSDKGFFERNRLMSILDLPRPEVLMNIWSMQVSTRDPKIASLEAESAGELVSHHNDVLENAVARGWDALSKKMSGRGFFEKRFYEYVTKKFAETEPYVEAADPVQPVATNKTGQGEEADPDEAIGTERRKRWGWCNPNQYCLGFIHAFEPVRPTLTNILLTIIAAHDSQGAADATICAMEQEHAHPQSPCTTGAAANQKSEADGSKSDSGSTTDSSSSSDGDIDEGKVNQFRKCTGEALKNLETLKKESAVSDCELTDRINLLKQVRGGQEESLQLQCFREQAHQSFGPAVDGAEHTDEAKHSDKAKQLDEAKRYAATRVGLLRAAVADFLFNYKWATQYPHDFVPYDLTQSAQELNAEFNPLVLAFNRDVKAFTQNLENELSCKHDANVRHLNPLAVFKKGDETFLNDGMISVRGISGLQSIVDTVTQSFFDATNPPSLTDLVKSVSDAEKSVPGVLKTNLSANEAAVLLGALNSVQPAQAKIGRELKLDITPHALAGASSAELEVKLTADETANPTLFKSGKQEEDTLSRVAKHDTNTRVRVESLKLFDVSAFSAMLQRPRSKFPIVPPLFEVPYFGSFVGLPLPGARVYHRSTAIVSAIIVPTAADLAFGIEFGSDRICETTTSATHRLTCHSAHSPYDFGGLPLRIFHKAMVQCFASQEKTAYPGKLWEKSEENAGKKLEESREPKECENLSLVETKLSEKNAEAAATEKKPEGAVPP